MDYDPENIGRALDVIAKGTKAADGALGLIKRVRDLLGPAEQETAPDIAKVNGLIVELMQEVTDTKLANVDLKEQLIALREQALQVAEKEREFDRYELIETTTGSFVFRLKEDEAQGQPTHYICPGCKEKGVRSILQGRRHYRTCPNCETGYEMEKSEPFHYPSRARNLRDF